MSGSSAQIEVGDLVKIKSLEYLEESLKEASEESFIFSSPESIRSAWTSLLNIPTEVLEIEFPTERTAKLAEKPISELHTYITVRGLSDWTFLLDDFVLVQKTLLEPNQGETYVTEES